MTDDVRRHPNGCIDFDFYRAEAVVLRRQAQRSAGLRLRLAIKAVMSGAIGFATVTPATPRGESAVAAPATHTR